MAIGAAIVGSAVVGGAMSSRSQRKAAKTAAAAQTEAADMSVAEQRRQFDALQEIMAPYVASGTPQLQELAMYSSVGRPALEAQQDLLGMNGPEAQQMAIDMIESSPMFQARVKAGEEAMLQNASATGGLRGGDIQGALAQFRPEMLSAEIENQYSKLGGMTALGQMNAQNLATFGQASAAGVGAQGMQSAANISNLLMGAGDARAQAALASGQATANMWGNIAGSVGSLGMMGAMGYGPLSAPTTSAPVTMNPSYTVPGVV